MVRRPAHPPRLMPRRIGKGLAGCDDAAERCGRRFGVPGKPAARGASVDVRDKCEVGLGLRGPCEAREVCKLDAFAIDASDAGLDNSVRDQQFLSVDLDCTRT
jgi:hypothetical protein